MADYPAIRDPARPPIHPGVLLGEEVFPALGRSMVDLAASLGISRQHLHDIVAEKAPISPEVAVRLGKLLGNGPDVWVRMQAAFDTWHAARNVDVAAIPTLPAIRLSDRFGSSPLLGLMAKHRTTVEVVRGRTAGQNRYVLRGADREPIVMTVGFYENSEVTIPAAILVDYVREGLLRPDPVNPDFLLLTDEGIDRGGAHNREMGDAA